MTATYRPRRGDRVTCDAMSEPHEDRDFLNECIRYVEEHGYTVRRARKATPRQLTGEEAP